MLMLARARIRPLTGARDAAIISLLQDTAMRRAEVANLQLDRVDLEDRTAMVRGKGDKERMVVFTDTCREALQWWLEQRDEWPAIEAVSTFFITINGGPMTPANVGHIVSSLAAECGLKGQVRTHLFRHSQITHLLEQGMSLPEASRLAGHSSVTTTMRYFHEDQRRLKEEYDRATHRTAPAGEASNGGAVTTLAQQGPRCAGVILDSQGRP